MAFSLSACSSDDDSADTTEETTAAAADDEKDTAGINELPVGDSGPQTDGPLTVDAVYFRPMRFDG